MSKFIKVNSEFNPDVNFWELNPQLILMHPFSRLYSLDGGGEHSSRLMWTVYFVSDPDESENKFFKFGKVGIEEMLEETYFDNQPPDWTNEDYLACIKMYPEVCLTAVQRALMMKKRALLKRGEFLDQEEYTRESMRDLDLAHSKTAKILEDYEKAEEKFMAEQSQTRVKGGRNQSKAELNEI